MEASEYSKSQYIGSFKCWKGHAQTVKMYASYKKITPEEKEIIDIKILKILGFL